MQGQRSAYWGALLRGPRVLLLSSLSLPTPPPSGPKRRPTVGSQGGAVSYQRGAPVTRGNYTTLPPDAPRFGRRAAPLHLRWHLVEGLRFRVSGVGALSTQKLVLGPCVLVPSDTSSRPCSTPSARSPHGPPLWGSEAGSSVQWFRGGLVLKKNVNRNTKPETHVQGLRLGSPVYLAACIRPLRLASWFLMKQLLLV